MEWQSGNKKFTTEATESTECERAVRAINPLGVPPMVRFLRTIGAPARCQ